MPERIADDPGMLKHSDEIGFFNDLIIDLKLQLLGKEMREPIDMDRMEMATKMVDKLFQCKEKVHWR